MTVLRSWILIGALALTLAGCLTDDKEESIFVTKDGPRSVSKGLFRNSELRYSFAHPKPWDGGLLKLVDAVGYWYHDTGIAHVFVYECHVDSVSLCESFLDPDREYGTPGAHTRQQVEVIENVSADTSSSGRITQVQRLHFRRGDKLVMLWLYGAPGDFGAGTEFRRIDSSLTFF